MEDTLRQEFLDFSIEKLVQFSERIESCLGRLTPEQIWARGSENENAIGNLVLHLSGNVRQWIVASVGGAPDFRDRNCEFDSRDRLSAAELSALLRNIVTEAVTVLDGVTAERMAERVIIQNYELTVLQAIYHVVEHFSGHTGQIIFATKMFTGADLGFYRHLRTPAAHDENTP